MSDGARRMHARFHLRWIAGWCRVGGEDRWGGICWKHCRR
jgi:hypothetical protein